MREYFRDVNDHLIRVRDQLDAMRDLLVELAPGEPRPGGVRQNDDMRKISAWVAIAAVPDRDRRHLRHELPAHAGAAGGSSATPRVLVLMLLICGFLYYRFRRSGWL